MSKFSIKNYIIVILLLLSVISIRFDRNDFFIKKYTTTEIGDSKYYIDCVEKFRNTEDVVLEAPFAYRPLVPFVASFLPFKSGISLNIVNAAVMLLTLLIFIEVLKYLNIKERIIFYSALMFVISFPTFYYSTIGVVDPIALLGIIFSFYLIISGRDILFPLSIGFFTFGKETILLVLPIAFLYLWINKGKFFRGVIISALGLVAYISAMYVIRNYIFPLPEDYVWNSSMQTFMSNIVRPRAILSFFLGFGLPGVISIYIFFRILIAKNKAMLVENIVYFVAIVEFIALYMYSMLSAYSDGRFIWPSMFFSILIYANYHNNKFIGKIKY